MIFFEIGAEVRLPDLKVIRRPFRRLLSISNKLLPVLYGTRDIRLQKLTSHIFVLGSIFQKSHSIEFLKCDERFCNEEMVIKHSCYRRILSRY